MLHRRPLTENVLSLAFLQTINYAAPLLTLPYLVRALQPAQFGLLSFAQSIVLPFDFFTDFGFNLSATRSIAVCRHEPEKLARIFWSTMFAKILLMIISGSVLALLVAATPNLRSTSALFAVNALYLLGTTLFPVWLFQGLERMKLAVGALGLARLLTVPALFLLVKNPHDFVIAGAIQASVELTASVVAVPLVFRRIGVGWYAPSFVDIKHTLRQAWPLFLSATALYLFTSSATVVLGCFAGKIEVGYFSAADKLIKASIAAISPLGQAMYPHIAAVKPRSTFSALRIIRKSFLATLILASLISVATALLSGPVCHIVLGRAFSHSAAVLEWLSPLPLLYGLIGVLGAQTMVIFDMDTIFARIMLAGVFLGVPVTALMSRSLGAIGAAQGSVIVAALIVAVLFGTLSAKGLQIWKSPVPSIGAAEAVSFVSLE